MVAQEFAKQKLKEEKYRIAECERVLKELDIPEAYSNAHKDRDYKEKLEVYLA